MNQLFKIVIFINIIFSSPFSHAALDSNLDNDNNSVILTLVCGDYFRNDENSSYLTGILKINYFNEQFKFRDYRCIMDQAREWEDGKIINQPLIRMNLIINYHIDQVKKWSLDGSYIGFSKNNWLMSLGSIERWWGPGWDGSLILSNNARPIPGLSIERLETTPSEHPWLQWMGSWQLVVLMGQLESNRDFSKSLFFGMRLNFKPWSTLEVGLSRTAMWGGEGRPRGLKTFFDLLIGQDNIKGNRSQEPGNQLAGVDVRWQLLGERVPVAFYGQVIGEDEVNLLPYKFMGLLGTEIWGAMGAEGGDTYRIYLEYADTRARFTYSKKSYNTSYEHSLYTSGYRYYGRSIGHTMDGDGLMYSLGVLLNVKPHLLWRFGVRNIQPNVDDSLNRNIMEYSVQPTFIGRRVQWGGGVSFWDEHRRESRMVDWFYQLNITLQF